MRSERATAPPSADTLFRPLGKRPAATTVTVRDLVQKVGRGEIRIPRFQRPLRWRSRDVVQLFDSVWRGYPIGSLLFWKRPAEAESIRVGGATLSAAAVADAWWVVDGQQRITALAASLLDLDHGGDRRWQVSFDPERQEFLPGLPRPERVGVDVPGSVLGDLRRLGHWVREHSVSDETVERIQDAQARILDYSIPAYVLETETEDDQALRGVFARTNSTGARMRADEVFQALLGAPARADSPSHDLSLLQRACDVDGFGAPPRAEVLKALLAMSDHDPTRRLGELDPNDKLRLVDRDRAERALALTVDFLLHDCGIPHVSLIPYPVVFVILGRWFHVHGESPPEARDLLARWVWRGAATGAHERAAVSRMRDQVRDINEGDEAGSLDRLLRRVSDRPSPGWDLERFNLKSARSRIETLALLARGPEDRLGQVTIADLLGDGRVAREVFAVSRRTSLSEELQVLLRTAANRVLLPDAPTGLDAKLKTWTWHSDRAALESHFIDEEAFAALCERDVATFLFRRAASLKVAVARFIDKRARWEQPTLQPLEAYFDLPTDAP